MLWQFLACILVSFCFTVSAIPSDIVRREGIVIPNEPHMLNHQPNDPRQVRLVVSNDFEDGSLGVWFDESNGNVRWAVEYFSSPAEVTYPAPPPASGNKYVRAIRNAALDAGSIFLKTQPFTASPGDTVAFTFWIRSFRTGANDLQVGHLSIVMTFSIFLN